jgi:hypothetical protein
MKKTQKNLLKKFALAMQGRLNWMLTWFSTFGILLSAFQRVEQIIVTAKWFDQWTQKFGRFSSCGGGRRLQWFLIILGTLLLFKVLLVLKLKYLTNVIHYCKLAKHFTHIVLRFRC